MRRCVSCAVVTSAARLQLDCDFPATPVQRTQVACSRVAVVSCNQRTTAGSARQAVSTTIRLQLDRATTIRRPTLRS